jgi:hypothetical protein
MSLIYYILIVTFLFYMTNLFLQILGFGKFIKIILNFNFILDYIKKLKLII